MKTGHKLPFLPFYLNDWESDEKVRLMGPATRYVYLHLLMHQWREGSIPADRKLLLRILRFPHDPQTPCQGYAPIDSENTGGLNEEDLSDHFNLEAALEEVLKCFLSDGRGHLKNKRLEVLRLQHLGRKCVFSARGKAGRMKQLAAYAQAQAGQSESDTESESKKHPPISPQGELLSSREHLEMSERQVASSRGLIEQSKSLLGEKKEFPDWVDIAVWSEFKEMRKKLRRPMTKYAESRIITKLEGLRDKGNNPNEVLNQSIENSWQDVFEIRRNGNGNGRKRFDENTSKAAVAEALRRAEERDRQAALRAGSGHGGGFESRQD